MYYTRKVGFEKLEEVLKIYKKQGLPLAHILTFFTNPENQEKVKTLYPQIMPLTIQEALSFPNAEQRMICMSIFPAEEIVTQLNAVSIDKQSITKNQKRWNAQGKEYEHTFLDKYELFKIPAEAMGMENRRWLKNDIYFVKCTCTSTAKTFYLYVSQEIGEQKDAIAAIAWTMRFNGKPLSKQHYLDYLEAET